MLVTPCIPSRQRAIRHFVLTNKVQTKHTALQVGTLVLAWRGVQRVQICLNGRSCAAVDACISPCHDVTIQNPQIALVNIKSVVLQLRQPGGALLSFSPMNCTLYASSFKQILLRQTIIHMLNNIYDLYDQLVHIFV